MEYSISIRITFPEEITQVLRSEKERFVNEHGSSYKSEPHVTLYLDRYTAEGYPKLLKGLRALQVRPFVFSLIAPKMKVDKARHRNLYFMDVSNKSQITELHEAISKIAIPYRSPLVRDKTIQQLRSEEIVTDGTRESLKALGISEEIFDPHITLGEIDFDKPQVNIAILQKDLVAIEGKEISVSSVATFFYKKEDGAEKAQLIEELTVPFLPN